MSTIPQLDISRFETDKENFVKDLGEAYSTLGFAGLVNHGIDQDLIYRALNVSKEVFELPEDVKKQYHKENGGARGYTPFGTEIAKDADHVDLKEFWHVGRELDQVSKNEQSMLPNVFPAEVPEFKEVTLTLFSELDKLARTVLRALALYLGEEETFFEDKVNEGNSILRPLHYPPIENTETACVRAAAHEDINVITLLVGSEQSGLEILRKDGAWIPVSIIEGTIICNIGDMMQRLTNYVMRSTTHRVVNPVGEEAKSSRYSIPFFMHFNSDYVIDALPQCVTDENPKRDEAITSDDYLKERLIEIGLLKK
ncbi:isopenicillin N synthase family dioxygenase [Algicola sagamiensis]|uniref:isopenicillin N synthase family dioxygenase n=1 Tax=Algicola sagamiensis TaxID=163869 RepID=UPI0003827711|nr:2-oxoglutarate and iron-dependent oxygenase domain-containing protein [Algicola sagamiensis]